MVEGTTLKKLDIHVHTPYSVCYEDHVVPEMGKKTTPEDIVQATLARSLDAIAITDHNCVGAIEAIAKAARGSGLVVFPGVEITTRGGHVLAIFEPGRPVDSLRRFLVSLGFQDDQWGDAYYQTELWTDEVFQRIEEAGGLAIAAHVDRQTRGFIASTEPLGIKVRIHDCPHLSAMEITDPRNKSRWNQGLMPHYPRKLACIQGSDAHAPGEIGRRPVYLRIPSLDLAGMRLAFHDFEGRILFPEELGELEAAS